MANLKSLRNRIQSTKNTQKVTKAMKLVSAAKLGRAQNAAVAARPYAESLQKLAGNLVSAAGDEFQHPLLEENSSKVRLIFVFSADKGLCGGFNANMSKSAVAAFEKAVSEGFTPQLVCIGRKSIPGITRGLAKKGTALDVKHISLEDAVKNPNILVDSGKVVHFETSFASPDHGKSSQVSEIVQKLYVDGAVGSCLLVYNKFRSAIAQIPTVSQLLPLSHETEEATGRDSSVLLEPDAETLLNSLLPRTLTIRVFQTLLDSVASEHAARMTAMDNATRNGQEMEQKLTITYQRERQAAITTELIEIISGAESLKS